MNFKIAPKIFRSLLFILSMLISGHAMGSICGEVYTISEIVKRHSGIFEDIRKSDIRNKTAVLLTSMETGVPIIMNTDFGSSQGIVTSVRIAEDGWDRGSVMFRMSGLEHESNLNLFLSEYAPTKLRLAKVLYDREAVLTEVTRYSVPNRDAAIRLYDALDNNHSVSVEFAEKKLVGNANYQRTTVTGRVSNIRLEEGLLIFDINGRQVKPASSTPTINVIVRNQPVSTRLSNIDPSIEARYPEVFSSLPANEKLRHITRILLTSLEAKVPVVGREGIGTIEGIVSDVTVERGIVLFKIGNFTYRALPGIQLALVELIRNPEAIIEKVSQVSQHNAEAVRTLIDAKLKQISVRASLGMDQAQGMVSDVRLEDGILKFRIGKTDFSHSRPSQMLSIRLLQ